MKKILFTLLLVLGISAAADAQVRFLDSSTDAVRKEAIAQDKLVFIDLYATWCGPCRQFGPVFEAVAAGNADKALFYSVDVDQNPELAGKFGVESIPMVVYMTPDGEFTSTVGYMDEATFASTLASKLPK